MQQFRPSRSIRQRPQILLWLVLFACTGDVLWAQPQGETKVPGGIQTFGGRQFWGDLVFFQGWRIQRNVFDGHCRLLDPHQKRHCAGSLESCQAALAELRAEHSLPAMKGKAVVLVHGIGRSHQSFAPMKKTMEQQGYTVVGFDYPSTQISIEAAAEYLQSVLQSLDGITDIHFVCHSMGGLVLRAWLMKHGDPRIRRAVMLGVPNKGAKLADMLKSNPLFKLALGPAGQQLASTNDQKFIDKLPVPTFEFGVVAGGRGKAKGYNPILKGDNDMTVLVASTRLPGAADFVLLPVIHTVLMSDERAIEKTIHFLKTGRFNPDVPPAPIRNGRDAPAGDGE